MRRQYWEHTTFSPGAPQRHRNADQQYMPAGEARFKPWVDVSFITIHRFKGSEADYVVLPEMLSVFRGRSFPKTRADDPVLALAMPSGDDYPLGEERRLFYVALTRAWRSVILFTTRGQCSIFLRELEADDAVAITDIDGKVVSSIIRREPSNLIFAGDEQFCHRPIAEAFPESRLHNQDKHQVGFPACKT